MPVAAAALVDALQAAAVAMLAVSLSQVFVAAVHVSWRWLRGWIRGVAQ